MYTVHYHRIRKDRKLSKRALCGFGPLVSVLRPPKVPLRHRLQKCNCSECRKIMEKRASFTLWFDDKCAEAFEQKDLFQFLLSRIIMAEEDRLVFEMMEKVS